MLSRYRASGLALKDFARQEGLPAGRLHSWLYQKHRSGAVGYGSASRPLFQEVNVAAVTGLVGNWAAEVSLPKGVAVRFGAAALPGWIGAVVQALQRPC